MTSTLISNPSENRTAEFNRVTAPFIGLSTAAIVLRIWARIIVHEGRRLWWDDWTAIICYLSGLVLSLIALVWSQHGLGRHGGDMSEKDRTLGLKLAWISYYFFVIGAGVIKISALLFYQRVLAVSKSFRNALWIVHGLVAAWMTAFLCTVIFNCSPVQKLYEPEILGHCADLYAWYMTCGALDVALDIVVLLLPLPVLWGLKMNTNRKLAVTAAFVCGYLVLVPSIGRLVTTEQRGHDIAVDITYTAITDLKWSYVQIPIGVISICVPSWCSLFSRWRSHGFLSLFSTRIPLSSSGYPSPRRSDTTADIRQDSIKSYITKTQSYMVEYCNENDPPYLRANSPNSGRIG